MLAVAAAVGEVGEKHRGRGRVGRQSDATQLPHRLLLRLGHTSSSRV